MKLNPDCIRDVMLEVEKSWEIYEEDSGALAMGCIEIGEIFQALPDYDKRISYTPYTTWTRLDIWMWKPFLQMVELYTTA